MDGHTGILTFLFTDIEHSTELVKRLQEGYGRVLAEHRELLRVAFAEHGGAEIDTQGDAFFAVFRRPREAVLAAIDAQRALSEHAWSDEAPLRVRIGVHTGEAYEADHGYVGVSVHRAARICTIAHGGQVLLSRSTAGILDDDEIRGAAVRDLGDHRLKDFERPERIFQLVIDGLAMDFPPLRAVSAQIPLTGTVTIVMVEGRRVMRLSRELSPADFGALLNDYRQVVGGALERLGGRELEVAADTATAAFATAKGAALAAVEVQRVVAAHAWAAGVRLGVTVGLHSGPAGVGWVGPAAIRCETICDAADAGEIFMSQATASLLEDENLGRLSVRDLGERTTRRSGDTVRVHELVIDGIPAAAER